MKKEEKNILKKQYLKKIPLGTLAEVEKFLNIIKHQKDFNKSVILFKKDYLRLFKENKKRFNDVIFMKKYTRLAV